MKDSFASFHPVTNLFYFALVIGFSLTLNHPLAQAIALVCAIVYAVSINTKNSLLFLLKYCLPMVLLTAFINPAFNHEGKTVLFYFSNGNPLTLESLLYGFSAGIMLVTLVLWFASFNRVMTSDKLIYLFGKLIPALSLVISMSLRFVPRFKSQMQVVIESQKCLEGGNLAKGVLSRLKKAITIFSIMITWVLENSIETADSMKSRGYGLKGRTAFSIYRFDERDKYVMLWVGFCGFFLLSGKRILAFGFRFFPSLRYIALDRSTIPFYCVYFALCITPFVLNLFEEKKWKTLVSKM